ncbi:hypothetical protein VP726_001730 [Salmonella enterica]|nr:hypothetical protein [Salmonella enterica subsp. enterica serovar Hvittingfoss]EBS3399993.1 hypothetical protein [Salmonella enterica subsp. enterica serovar Hvittingfoss]EIP5375400.1 hypothetical protein [Salmonella enterica]EMD1129247.1 hypothetical protein [Salmonella enterica]
MSEKTVILTRKQYRSLCDALINAVNMGPQLLAISTDGSELADKAFYQAQLLRQAIEHQLTVASGVRGGNANRDDKDSRGSIRSGI